MRDKGKQGRRAVKCRCQKPFLAALVSLFTPTTHTSFRQATKGAGGISSSQGHTAQNGMVLCLISYYQPTTCGFHSSPAPSFTVVDLRQLPFHTPAQLFLLRLFQTLKLFDNVNFKFRTYPHGKLKSDIFMSVRTPIAPYGIPTTFLTKRGYTLCEPNKSETNHNPITL